MNAVFGDERQDAQAPRRKHVIVPRCGSCERRVPTILLPISGLRRCHDCAALIRAAADEARWWRQGFCEWPRMTAIDVAGHVAPQPSLPVDRAVPSSQPTVYRPGAFSSSSDSKRRAAGDEVA